MKGGGGSGPGGRNDVQAAGSWRRRSRSRALTLNETLLSVDQMGWLLPDGSTVHPQFFEASLTFLVSAAMAAYALSRAERSTVHWLVVSLVAGMMVWSGCVALSRALPPGPESLFFSEASFVGIFAVPPIWFLLGVHLSKLGRLDSNRMVKVAAAAPSALFLLALVSNPLHRGFIADSSVLESAPPEAWAGPLFWVWAVWAYLLIVAATIIYLTWSFRLLSGPDRTRGLLLGSAASFPLAASMIHNLSGDPSSYDRTPLFIGASVCILFFVDWRYRLLDTMPLARRDVIDQLADGVIVANSRGVILHLNSAAEAMMEAPAAALRGKQLVGAVAMQARGRMPLDEARFQEIVDRLCHSDGEFQVQVENHAGRTYEIRGATVRSATGHPSGFYLILRDRTEQERYERLLRRTRRLESVKGLAGGIAHEVNNPLAYVRSNMGHVLGVVRELSQQPVEQEGHRLKEELAELCAVIEESLEGIGKIGSIIEGVQRFSRLDADQRERLPLSRIVHDSTGSAELQRWPEVKLVCEVEEEPVFVEGSAESLTQALVNLIDNAAQAVRGQGGGEVRVRARATEALVEIDVCDDGPGVPEEISEQIYDPFFTTKGPGDGTGLGLAVTFRIAREHGGVLQHRTSESGGACFSMSLPRA
jgi:two-component system sensor histidine kinase HupT/HoxJ